MELRRKLHTPYWRDPKHQPEPWPTKYRLALLSAVAVLALGVPPSKGYDEPISVQLATHEWTAWICLTFMIGTLAYFAKRLWLKEHYVGTIACAGMCGCLALIAITDPFSRTHLGAFSILVLIMACLHWGLYWTHENLKLFVLAGIASGAVGICLFDLGIGERLLVMASTASINVVFYEHMAY